MARAFAKTSTEQYAPSDLTENANQEMEVYKHVATNSGADFTAFSSERPWIVHGLLTNHTTSSNFATYDSANSGQGTHTLDYFVVYEMLKRGWLVFSPKLTTAGFGVLQGGGAAAKAGTTRYQSASDQHAAWNRDICYAMQHVHNQITVRGGDATRGYGAGRSAMFQALLWGGARTYVPGELGVADTMDLGFQHPLRGGIVGIDPPSYYPAMDGDTAIAGFSALPGDEDTAATTLSQLNFDLLDYFSPVRLYERGNVRPPLLLTSTSASSAEASPQDYDTFPPRFTETDASCISHVNVFKRKFPQSVTGWAMQADSVLDKPDFGLGELDDRFGGGATDELNTPAVRRVRDWLIDQDVKNLGRYYRLGRTFRMRLDTTAYACVSPNSKYKTGARISMYGTPDSVANVIMTDDSTVEPADSDTGERYILPDAVTANGAEPMVTLDIKGQGAIWMKATATNYTFVIEY